MIRNLKELNTSSLRLDRNECICPSFIRQLLNDAKITEVDYFKYSSTLNIELSLGSYFNCVDPVSQVYTDSGSEQVLKKLIEVLNCRTWVTTEPTFEMFSVYCKIYKKQIKTVPYIYDNETFTVDVKSEGSKDRGLYIVSPHNPTGYILTTEQLAELSSIYKYIIVDQAYLSPLEPILFTVVPKNVIIVRTFSKMGGLTGMRFGFCLSHDRDIIDKLNLLRPMYLNSLTIKLVETILTSPDMLTPIEQEFIEVKKLLNLNVFASAGNFILLKNVTNYKEHRLKKYTISNQDFYRMTLFDKETYYKL